jgi:hypothetical protein
VDQEGNLGRSLQVIRNIDVRDRPWFRLAKNTGKPGWITPFQIGSTHLLAVNTYPPYFDESQELRGVFAVNLSLRQLTRFLQDLAITDVGTVYITDSHGMLIATSTGDQPYISSRGPAHR